MNRMWEGEGRGGREEEGRGEGERRGWRGPADQAAPHHAGDELDNP